MSLQSIFHSRAMRIDQQSNLSADGYLFFIHSVFLKKYLSLFCVFQILLLRRGYLTIFISLDKSQYGNVYVREKQF